MLFACIVNDLHRAAGRSGVGAVMGSKNLKAVAVRGTKGVGGIRDAKAFMKATTAAKKVLAENAVTGQGLPTYGTQVLMNVINEMGALPTRNHRDVQFEGAQGISAEAMHEPRADRRQGAAGDQPGLLRLHHRLRPHSRRSTRPTSAVVNKPEYWGASGGLEYEAAWALGAANGVNDLEALQYANLLCNEDGMRPDLLRRHRRRGDGALRDGRADQGADRHRGAVRLGAGAGESRRDDGQGRGLRQGDRAWARRGSCAKYGHPELSHDA